MAGWPSPCSKAATSRRRFIPSWRQAFASISTSPRCAQPHSRGRNSKNAEHGIHEGTANTNRTKKRQGETADKTVRDGKTRGTTGRFSFVPFVSVRRKAHQQDRVAPHFCFAVHPFPESSCTH